jgi:hypothetical protein
LGNVEDFSFQPFLDAVMSTYKAIASDPSMMTNSIRVRVNVVEV